MTLQATVGGTVYDLSDGTLCYYVGQDGLGIPQLRRLQEQGPQQNGTVDTGYQLGPRAFRLFFDVPGESAADVYDRRTDLLDIFKPSDTVIVLTFRLPNGDVRLIDAHVTGGLTFSTSSRQGYVEKVMVDLNAPDPIFYDPTAESLALTLGLASAELAVPAAVPLGVGEDSLNVTEVLTYAGLWREYPYKIRVNGYVSNLVILNNTTGDRLDFTEYTLGDDQYFDIDLRYGYKTITRNDGANAINALYSSSDLATWHLEPGANSITVTGNHANGNTAVTIYWYLRYIGI